MRETEILGLFPQPSPRSRLLRHPLHIECRHQRFLQVSPSQMGWWVGLHRLYLKSVWGWKSHLHCPFSNPDLSTQVGLVIDIRDTQWHFQLYRTHRQHFHDLCYLHREIPWYLLSIEGDNQIVSLQCNGSSFGPCQLYWGHNFCLLHLLFSSPLTPESLGTTSSQLSCCQSSSTSRGFSKALLNGMTRVLPINLQIWGHHRTLLFTTGWYGV